jgi:hypothetical protein
MKNKNSAGSFIQNITYHLVMYHLTSAPKSGDVLLQMAPKLAVASMASTAKLLLGK